MKNKNIFIIGVAFFCSIFIFSKEIVLLNEESLLIFTVLAFFVIFYSIFSNLFFSELGGRSKLITESFTIFYGIRIISLKEITKLYNNFFKIKEFFFNSFTLMVQFFEKFFNISINFSYFIQKRYANFIFEIIKEEINFEKFILSKEIKSLIYFYLK